MPAKKDSCNLIQRGVAGSTPGEILETIRTEYSLPERAQRQSDAPHPDVTDDDERKPPQGEPTQVKP